MVCRCACALHFLSRFVIVKLLFMCVAYHQAVSAFRHDVGQRYQEMTYQTPAFSGPFFVTTLIYIWATNEITWANTTHFAPPPVEK